MIRIGIVDDEKQERDQLKQALARFSAENGTELNVQEFGLFPVLRAAVQNRVTQGIASTP